MDRQFLTGLISIVLIVGVVAWSFSTTSSPTTVSSTTGGNAFATPDGVTATGASSSPIAAIAPLAVTIQANAGTLPAGTTLVVAGEKISYRASPDLAPGTLDGISIELLSSERASAASFSLGSASAADGTATRITDLVAQRADNGVWYALVTAKQLALVRTRTGAGWYVVTATATRGTEETTQRIAFFVQ